MPTPRAPLHSLLLLSSLMLLVSAAAALAYDDGPPDGMAGNPPNAFTCVMCHGDFPLNSGDGSLELLGLPTTFVPGQAYDLTVRLLDPGQMRWGFELTVLDSQNQQAGTLEVVDSVNTQLSDNPAPEPDYLKQTEAGSYEGNPGPVQWQFRWVAPAASEVTFYQAGNAANFDHMTTGDYIYAIQRQVGGTVPVEAATWGRIKRISRAPGLR